MAEQTEDSPKRGRGRPAGVKDSGPRMPKRRAGGPNRTATRIAHITNTLPLDVLIWRMLKLYNNGNCSEEDADRACAVAKEAAPYLHPRLSSVEAKVTHKDLREIDEELLLQELAALRGQECVDEPLPKYPGPLN